MNTEKTNHENETQPFLLGAVISCKKLRLMNEKMLNEAEILSIKRLRAKKVPYQDIADRIGISVERVKAICKQKRK